MIIGLSISDQKIIRDMLALFEDIDRQTAAFAKESGLKCKSGCGACCTNPQIETTVAEVMPLAAYLWSSGQAVEPILATSSKGVCVFYRPDPQDASRGRCGIYPYRPGICRLFGFAARRDKHGKSVLVTCKIIKESQPQICQGIQENSKDSLNAPMLSTYACAVANIDPSQGQMLLPINQAIRQAVEKVGYYLKIKQ